jgi:hypothetical protein
VLIWKANTITLVMMEMEWRGNQDLLVHCTSNSGGSDRLNHLQAQPGIASYLS